MVLPDAYRQVGPKNTVPGMWVNKNAGNPKPGRSIPTGAGRRLRTSVERQATARLTWQATPRNKFNFHWSEQYNDANYERGRHRDADARSDGPDLLQPVRQPQATWSSPVSSRLLLEAGWGMYQARYRIGTPRTDGTHNPLMIRVHGTGRRDPGPDLPDAPAPGLADSRCH